MCLELGDECAWNWVRGDECAWNWVRGDECAWNWVRCVSVLVRYVDVLDWVRGDLECAWNWVRDT